MSGIAETIAAILKAIRARQRRLKSSQESSGAQSAWDAMILEQAGPNRSDPIRPAKKIDLGKRR